MPNAEIVRRVEEFVGRQDYDNAFDLADSLSEEPWRSCAYELLVGLFISSGFVERFGVDAIRQAHIIASNYIQDSNTKAKSFVAIANVASENGDWETALKASRQAVFECFYR